MTNPKEFIRDASGATYRIGTLLGRGLFAKTFTARSEDGQEWVVKTSLGPNDFPEDQYLQPYINQFYGYNKGTRGGYSPQISASIYKNKFTVTGGTTIIDEDNLKGRWHKIEYHFKWSVNNDGFIKVYHNSELKLNRTGFTTMNNDFVEFKYGTYSAKDNMTPYASGYQFPSHTIYFSGVSVSKTRDKLKVNKIK